MSKALKDKALKDKALTGYAIRNLTMETVVNCFFACVDECLCLSFQTCSEAECQLLSSTRFQTTLDIKKGCIYYDMFSTTSQKVRNSDKYTSHGNSINDAAIFFEMDSLCSRSMNTNI